MQHEQLLIECLGTTEKQYRKHFTSWTSHQDYKGDPLQIHLYLLHLAFGFYIIRDKDNGITENDDGTHVEFLLGGRNVEINNLIDQSTSMGRGICVFTSLMFYATWKQLPPQEKKQLVIDSLENPLTHLKFFKTHHQAIFRELRCLKHKYKDTKNFLNNASTFNGRLRR